ncbi:extracellular solute-binding protein [Saccharibacillus endophyticus]|nr:extracellular solute-binding protein [Saccharibacillus endophyticus]
MMKPKKSAWGLTSLLLISTLLSACGVGNPSSSATTPNQPAKESGKAVASAAPVETTGLSGKLNVQLIGGFVEQDKTDPKTGAKTKGVYVLKEEFEKMYPGTEVNFVLMGWDSYNEKTQTMLQSNAADVYQLPGIATFAEQGLLEPLQSYIDQDGFDLNQYFYGQVDGWKAMGPEDADLQIYGLPFIGDTRVITYDKQLFDEWGVSYLSKEPTIEEILEKAEQMTGTNPKTGEQNYGLTFNKSDAADTVMNINESKGGKWGTGFLWKDMELEFNTPTMAESLDLLKKAKEYAPEGVMAGQGAEKFLTADNDVAINLRSAPGFVTDIRTNGTQDRFDAALLFINPEKKMGGMFAGSPFAIGKSSTQKDLAWEWLKFSSSDFYQQFMWDNYRIESTPVVKSSTEWASVKEIPQMSVVLEAMGRLWAPRYPYRSGQPRYILSENVEKVLLDSASSQEALDQAQKEATEWIGSQK